MSVENIGNKIFICFDMLNSTELIDKVKDEERLAKFFYNFYQEMDFTFKSLVSANLRGGGLVNRTGDGAIYYVSCSKNNVREKIKKSLEFSSHIVETTSSLLSLSEPLEWQDFNPCAALTYGELYQVSVSNIREYHSKYINLSSKATGIKSVRCVNHTSVNRRVFAENSFYKILNDEEKSCFKTSKITENKGSLTIEGKLITQASYNLFCEGAKEKLGNLSDREDIYLEQMKRFIVD